MTPVASDRPPPKGRTGQYAVGLGMLASLLAGRASYRLIQLATTALLLPVWGADRYGTYAAALASVSWLLALVFTGPEKTVLKLLPRAPRTGPAVRDALLAVLWWLPLPLAVGFGLAAAGSRDGATAVYLGAATMQLSIGCTLLLVGLHRATGRPRSDSLSFLVMSIGQVALLAAAAGGYLGPVGYLGAVVVMQLGLNVALTVALGRPSLRIRHRPRFLGRLGWTAVLLGGTELFRFAATAVLFVVLTASAHAAQVGRLYVVVLTWSAAVNLLLYVFCVYAPRTSLRLAGRASSAGREFSARLAWRVAAFNAGWLVAAGTALTVTDLATTASPARQVLWWAVLLATRAPAVAAGLWASYLLENTDSTAPRVTALAAVTGLAAATAAGLAIIPALGGVGVIVAFAIGDLGYACVIAARGGVGSRDRITPGRRADRRPASGA